MQMVKVPYYLELNFQLEWTTRNMWKTVLFITLTIRQTLFHVGLWFNRTSHKCWHSPCCRWNISTGCADCTGCTSSTSYPWRDHSWIFCPNLASTGSPCGTGLHICTRFWYGQQWHTILMNQCTLCKEVEICNCRMERSVWMLCRWSYVRDFLFLFFSVIMWLLFDV